MSPPCSVVQDHMTMHHLMSWTFGANMSALGTTTAFYDVVNWKFLKVALNRRTILNKNPVGEVRVRSIILLKRLFPKGQADQRILNSQYLYGNLLPQTPSSLTLTTFHCEVTSHWHFFSLCSVNSSTIVSSFRFGLRHRWLLYIFVAYWRTAPVRPTR